MQYERGMNVPKPTRMRLDAVVAYLEIGQSTVQFANLLILSDHSSCKSRSYRQYQSY